MNDDISGLGFQLASYRFEDGMRAARENRLRRASDDMVDVVIAHYNDLADRYNKLSEVAARVERSAHDLWERLCAAEAKLIAKDREVADLNKRLADTNYENDKSHAFWMREASYYRDRTFAAERELKDLRSQTE